MTWEVSNISSAGPTVNLGDEKRAEGPVGGQMGSVSDSTLPAQSLADEADNVTHWRKSPEPSGSISRGLPMES